jgi:hypothetical protein
MRVWRRSSAPATLGDWLAGALLVVGFAGITAWLCWRAVR